MEEFDVVVIGAGLTGIGASYYLQSNGLTYKVFEASEDLGGTWRIQKWHGARSDSDIIKYSYSFMPYFSDTCLQSQEHIQEYLHSVTEKFGIKDHISLKERVEKIVFNSQEKNWTVYTTKNQYKAQFIINGNGYFSDAFIPKLEGREQFKGEIVHTIDLDSRRTFYDKKVVVVGSGSTAICCAPELVKVSKSVVLLQRSPSYIYEESNKIGWFLSLSQKVYRKGIHFPIKMIRYLLQLKDDLTFVIFRKFPRFARWIFKRMWVRFVGEEIYKKDFTPKYEPWEQRIPVGVGFRDKVLSGKLKIKTAEIDCFKEHSILLKNGEEVPCDVCVLATGFHCNFFKFDAYLDQKKIDFSGINIFKGVVVGGMPNFFHPVGVWHSSWTHHSELGMGYALKIIKYMKKHGLKVFSIDRLNLKNKQVFNASYVLRYEDTLPRAYGSLALPSIDSLVSFWFHPSDFHFSK